MALKRWIIWCICVLCVFAIYPVGEKNERKQVSYCYTRTKTRSSQRSANVSTPKRGIPYYARQANLSHVVGLSRLRNNTNDPHHSYAMIASPFLTNETVVNDVINNAQAGVRQRVYVSPHARNPQHGNACIEKLQAAGIPVYIVPGLHTKAVHMQYTDVDNNVHKKNILGSANVTYRGMYHNAGDSWMVLPDDVNDSFAQDMYFLKRHGVLYHQYTPCSAPVAQLKKHVDPVTPKKKVVNSWHHDVTQQMINSIHNTEAGDTIEFGTFALSHSAIISALKQASYKGVTVCGYVNSGAQIPQSADEIPIYRVDAGHRKIYHDKALMINREQRPSTVYYGTGNLTQQSCSKDFNQFFVSRTPRSCANIAGSFHEHVAGLNSIKRTLSFS